MPCPANGLASPLVLLSSLGRDLAVDASSELITGIRPHRLASAAAESDPLCVDELSSNDDDARGKMLALSLHHPWARKKQQAAQNDREEKRAKNARPMPQEA